MLYVTPLSNENEAIEMGPAVQVNAVELPSKSALTNIYKVSLDRARLVCPLTAERHSCSAGGGCRWSWGGSVTRDLAHGTEELTGTPLST